MDNRELLPEEPETREDSPAPAAPPPQSTASRFFKWLLSWVKIIVVAFVLALLIKSFLVVNATVMSGSMENTIMTGDRIMCNRLAYLFGEPQRFDIIAFDFTEDDGTEQIYVKRVIGLPGETVYIFGGKVYINDDPEPLRDDFILDEPWGDFGPFDIPEDHYFVLGDNRIWSYDSKSWPNPYLPEDDILGKAMFRYYPNLTWLGNK